MQIILSKTAEELGKTAAGLCRDLIEKAVAQKGRARMVFSTGASQFTTFEALLNENIDWRRVEMFHLDEYVGLPESHPASFRRYLKERFIGKVDLKSVCLVDGEADIRSELARLTREIREAPVDIGLIGIGENAHIAFNDPPADFDTREAYRTVRLSETCKAQQVREGWFPTAADVPRTAITMTPFQIMSIGNILSCVPYGVKAKAVKDTVSGKVSPDVPATLLKEHACWTLLVDAESAGLLTPEELACGNYIKR